MALLILKSGVPFTISDPQTLLRSYMSNEY